MKGDINDELIIGYINNALSKTDRISFEKEMQINPLMAERYAFLKNVATATEINSAAIFKKKIVEAESQLEKDKFFETPVLPPEKSTPKKSKLVYAFVLLFVLFLASLLFVNIQCSDKAIAATAMEQESLRSYTTRSANQDVDVIAYQTAINYYQQGSGTKSIDLLKEISSTSSVYHETQYALAYIHYKTENLNEAIRIAGKLVLEDCDIKDKAGWLKLLAAIEANGYDKSNLEAFIKTAPRKHFLNKAKALQAQMESPLRNFVF